VYSGQLLGLPVVDVVVTGSNLVVVEGTCVVTGSDGDVGVPVALSPQPCKAKLSKNNSKDTRSVTILDMVEARSAIYELGKSGCKV